MASSPSPAAPSDGPAPLLDALPDPIVRVDLQGCIRYANRAYERLHGHAPGAAVGTLLEGVHSGAATMLSDALAQVRNPAAALVTEFEVRRPDGSTGRYERRIVTECGADGGIASIVAVDRDVTNERRYERELAALNERLSGQSDFVHTVLGRLPSAVMLVGAEGRVRLINQRACEILQLPADAVGQELAALFPQAVELMSEGTSRQTTLVTPARKEILVGFSSVRLVLPAEPEPAVLIVFQELDEIEKLRTELRRQERTANLGRFVAGIAHELRNPLFAISSTCQILAREIDSPLHRQLIGAMSSEILRVKRLIEDLLSYGNPNPLRFKPANPWQIADEVVNQLKPEAERKDVKLIREPGGNERALRIDPERIREVFINLLENALRATASGTVRIASAERDGQISFTIADTGTGIAQEDLPLVFEPFFSRSHGGTGLGLSIVKKTIEDHGGNVVITHSQPNAGTTIQFWFPEG
jgi:PAS domain S-box-containing protein